MSKLQVTEDYLRGNYKNYCESCDAFGTSKQTFEEWKEWFLKFFNAEMTKPPTESLK